MQSIKKFFSPLIEAHNSDNCIPAKPENSPRVECQKTFLQQKVATVSNKKSPRKKSSNKLLEIIDYEVEDISGLICDKNLEAQDQPVEDTSDEHLNPGTTSNGEISTASEFDILECENPNQSKMDVSKKKLNQHDAETSSSSDLDNPPKDLRPGEDDLHAFDSTNGNNEMPGRDMELKSADSKSDYQEYSLKSPSRHRRFSFNIKSPKRKTSKFFAFENKLNSSDTLFDEAFNINITNNLCDVKKEIIDDEITHPNKRFKSVSSSSHHELPSTAQTLQYPVLVAKKLTIPCLQPPSAFADPPKNKEFYSLRHSIAKSRQKNYVIMSRAIKKQNLRDVYFEIEKILTHKTILLQSEKKFMFLVKWSGFSDKYTSWEPEEHFNCSPHFLLYYVNNLLAAVELNSEISEQLKVTKLKMKKRTQKISTICSQVHVWQLNAELSTVAFKLQYKRLLKQYANKVQEDLGPSFPTVQIQNTVDFNLPPLNFTFVRDRFAGKGVHISDDTIIGCICSGEYGVRGCCLSPDVQCCPHLGGANPPYNSNEKLTLKPGYPIYECNARCSCGPDCGNRIVQRGSQVKTSVYKTPDKGWGLKTLQAIPKGTFVVEYVGEVITFDEAEQRGKDYDAQGLTYLFDLDYQTSEGIEVDEGMYTIDAAFYGNTSHFINHSCDPNLAVFSCWISNLDIRLPHICLFAVKSISAGEELTFNYQIDRIVEEDNRAAQRLSVECRCGTKKCVRYLHG